MKNKFLFISLILVFVITFLNIAQAASVRTYIKNGTVTIDGQEYDEILVKCKSSLEVTNNILRAKGTRMWCAGIDVTRCFSRSEINAAQAVCKRGYLKELAALQANSANDAEGFVAELNEKNKRDVAASTQEAAVPELETSEAKAISQTTSDNNISESNVDNPSSAKDELRKELIEIEKQRIEMKQRELELRQKELELQKRELGS